MSECSITKFLEGSGKNSGVMESCYKLYMWLNHTVFMLLLQIIWKIRQVSDYFINESVEDSNIVSIVELTPLTKELKKRRHIRSMSDVQSSTPYNNNKSRYFRKSSYHTLIYDSDTKTRRIRTHYRPRYAETSDSSDLSENCMKARALQDNIMKPKDSMRFL